MINFDKILIAHRGESFLAPENTLTAINLAWELGDKAVEIDVHITLDNEVVVIHDENTKRVGDINKIISQTLLADLKKVDVGSFKDNKWKGEQIPTLSEVLITIPTGAKLVIEIKKGAKDVTPICNAVKELNIHESQIEFISFDLNALSETKKILPQYKMLWLLDLDYHIPSCLLFINTEKIIQKLESSKLDGINVWAGKKISKEFVSKFKEQNYLVYTWTVNDVKIANKLLDMNVDAITTDRSAWLRKQLIEDNK